MPTLPNERALGAASAALDKLISQIGIFRSGLAAVRIPLDAANDRLDHSEDLAAILSSQLTRAASDIDREIERLLETADLARDAANDDGPLTVPPYAAALIGRAL